MNYNKERQKKDWWKNQQQENCNHNNIEEKRNGIAECLDCGKRWER